MMVEDVEKQGKRSLSYWVEQKGYKSVTSFYEQHLFPDKMILQVKFLWQESASDYWKERIANCLGVGVNQVLWDD